MIHFKKIVLFFMIILEGVSAKPFNDHYKFIGNISNEGMIIAHLELEAQFQGEENGNITSIIECQDFQLNPCNNKNKTPKSFCSSSTGHGYNVTNIAISRLQMDPDRVKNSNVVNEL